MCSINILGQTLPVKIVSSIFISLHEMDINNYIQDHNIYYPLFTPQTLSDCSHEEYVAYIYIWCHLDPVYFHIFELFSVINSSLIWCIHVILKHAYPSSINFEIKASFASFFLINKSIDVFHFNSLFL